MYENFLENVSFVLKNETSLKIFEIVLKFPNYVHTNSILDKWMGIMHILLSKKMIYTIDLKEKLSQFWLVTDKNQIPMLFQTNYIESMT